MYISARTKSLVEEINDYSQSPVKNNYEVSIIIEDALSNQKDKIFFKELIFSAKYLSGLNKVLSDMIINTDKYMEKIFEEFNNNLQKFIGLLGAMVNSFDDKTGKHFNSKYLGLNHECLVHTMELIGDLTLCKEFFNANPGKLLQ